MINLSFQAKETKDIPRDMMLVGFDGLRIMGIGCRNSILRKLREGSFPLPYLINGKKLWRIADIERYYETLPRWNPADTE